MSPAKRAAAVKHGSVMRWIEAVPNVSEGRDLAAVSRMAGAFTGAPGSLLLDVHSDPSHHRSVITSVHGPEHVTGAACRLAEAAIAAIDLRRHEGVHPRIGALDVLPLVPLGPPDDAALADAVARSREVAKTLAQRFEVPVFLYGEDAPEPGRGLAALRRGGLAALGRRLGEGSLAPDFGPRRLHPSAGAVAVGVRGFLIAFNVALRPADLDAARAVARQVRASSGGLDALQALGLALPDRDLVQVSMNLTDFRRTSLADAFDAVRGAAAPFGLEVESSEIVGLVPEAARFAGMRASLRLAEEPASVEERMAALGAS